MEGNRGKRHTISGVAWRLTSRSSSSRSFGWLTNGVLVAMGSYLVALFGGVVLYRTLTL